jgi:hypothetical protein
MEICGRGLCQDAADQRAFANALEALRLEILFESSQSLRFIFSQIRSCYPLCILRDSTMNRLARLLFNESIPMMKRQRVIMGRSRNHMYGATCLSSSADDEALEFNTPAGCDVWHRRWRSCGRIRMPWTRAWRNSAPKDTILVKSRCMAGGQAKNFSQSRVLFRTVLLTTPTNRKEVWRMVRREAQ